MGEQAAGCGDWGFTNGDEHAPNIVDEEELQLNNGAAPARPAAPPTPTPPPAPTPASPNGQAMDDANAEVFGGMTREQIHHAAVLDDKCDQRGEPCD